MNVKVKFEAIAVDSTLHHLYALDTSGNIWMRDGFRDWKIVEAPDMELHPNNGKTEPQLVRGAL